MADIDMLHHDLTRGGGGEAVAAHAITALQRRHDVTLHTFSRPDIRMVNGYFNAAIDPDAIDIVRYGVTWRIIEVLRRRTGFGFDVLMGALLARRYQRHRSKGELAVSTINELPLGVPSIQYIHLPQFDRGSLPATHTDDSAVRDVYDRISRALCGYNPSKIRADTRLLANSEWTASRTCQTYGTEPSVLYPPVDTETFQQCRSTPWAERTPSFVSVGRIAPIKRTVRVIRIVESLRRERGCDADLYLVGPPSNEQYAEKVRSLAAEREYVHLEGELTHGSERFQSLFAGNRFYLNGTDHETFGISIAEAIAAGMLPFVPANGGQVEVVGELDSVQYTDVPEAVERITTVLDNRSLQESLRDRLPDPAAAFGRERFQRQFADHVQAAIQELVERG